MAHPVKPINKGRKMNKNNNYVYKLSTRFICNIFWNRSLYLILSQAILMLPGVYKFFTNLYVW